MDEENVVQYYNPTKNDDLALKKCPFCGFEAPVYERYKTEVGYRWRVLCPNCMAEIDPGYAQERHTVQDLWNRRCEK